MNVIIYYRAHDRAVAMERLKDIGVSFTTSESLMFQLLRTSTHPKFKSCAQLLRNANLEPNGFSNQTTL